jgi:hypothetical protein
MTRLKIIDITLDPTPASKIIERLGSFLLALRQRQPPKTDDDDFDLWPDSTSPKARLSSKDERRIRQRAEKLVAQRLAASGAGHLKKEELDRLKPCLAGMKAILPGSEDWADEIAARLHADMPWMARATEYAWFELRRCAKDGTAIRLRPVILNGPPGIGKSVWARQLAHLLHLPMAAVDASTGSAGMAVVGVERGWGTAQSGRPIDLMLATRIANPLITVDEICKSGRVTSTNGTAFSLTNALLSVLEPATARAWECPYFRVRFDMSHLSWILTANDVARVPEPLRNRCQIVNIPDIAEDQLHDFAERHARRAGLSTPSIDAILEALAKAPYLTGRRQSLRDVIRLCERAEVLQTRPRLH